MSIEQRNRHVNTSYKVILINHMNDRINQSYHFAGNKYEYLPIVSVNFESTSIDECLVFRDKLTDSIIDENKTLSKLLVSKNVVQIFDRSKGFIFKNNELLHTIEIVECSF